MVRDVDHDGHHSCLLFPTLNTSSGPHEPRSCPRLDVRGLIFFINIAARPLSPPHGKSLRVLSLRPTAYVFFVGPGGSFEPRVTPFLGPCTRAPLCYAAFGLWRLTRPPAANDGGIHDPRVRPPATNNRCTDRSLFQVSHPPRGREIPDCAAWRHLSTEGLVIIAAVVVLLTGQALETNRLAVVLLSALEMPILESSRNAAPKHQFSRSTERHEYGGILHR